VGLRGYVPQIGRFLTPDPVAGGSANAYDYAYQEPVNAFDLNGTCGHRGEHHNCHLLPQERRALHAARAHHLVLPIVVHCHCVKHENILEEAGHVISTWIAPARRWTASRAAELAGTVSDSVSSIPCRTLGLALAGGGVTTGVAGLATVWIPGVGETLLLVSRGLDLASVAAVTCPMRRVCAKH
jgi:hypothetical protein